MSGRPLRRTISSPENKKPQRELWHGCVNLFPYVEKKTCGFAVEASRIAVFPNTIGAGFAEIGCIFESLRSSASTLRCSCGWGRLIGVIPLLSHVAAARRSPANCTIYEASSVESLKHSDHSGVADNAILTLWHAGSRPL